MAKKKKNAEVITNSDNLNNDQSFEVQNLHLNILDIKRLIRVVRGQQVMLDSDLAMLYGVETRSLNQAVKRNIERFPDDFMFQMTKSEWHYLKSQFYTHELADNENDTNLKSQIVISSWGGSRSIPFVFTRNGVGMLSSVLKSKTAIEVNKRIMRAFTAIPDLINNSTLVMQRILNIEQHQAETIQLAHRNHDRFLIIDNNIYILGASVKDMGTGLCAITKMQMSPDIILHML